MSRVNPDADITERLRRTYGRMECDDPDGFGWEWETDKLASEAAREIERLRALVPPAGFVVVKAEGLNNGARLLRVKLGEHEYWAVETDADRAKGAEVAEALRVLTDKEPQR